MSSEDIKLDNKRGSVILTFLSFIRVGMDM
jgi:hypothetical protein